MGNQLVQADLKDGKDLYTIVTRDDKRFYIMAINISRTQTAAITLNIPGVELSGTGSETQLSHREYFWDYIKHAPRWSRKPQSHQVTLTSPPRMQVPAFSVKILEIPLKGHNSRSLEAVRNADINPIDILLPDSAPEDLPVEGWVFLPNDPADPKVSWRTDKAAITVKGPAGTNASEIAPSEAAGRFFLHPTGHGKVTVCVDAGSHHAEHVITVEPLRERNRVYWKFENQVDKWHASSSFRIYADDTVLANQKVAAVDLSGAIPKPGHDLLMQFSPLPKNLPLKRVSGVVLDVGFSNQLKVPPEGMGVSVVLQSSVDHWIPLGTITLKPGQNKLKSYSFKLPDTKYYRVMPHLYSLRLHLQRNNGADTPMQGRIYFDNIGFILR